MSGDHNQHQADQCEHLWRYIGSKRQAVWQCPYCESLRFVEPPARDCYGDGNVYRGERTRDSEVKTVWVSLTDEEIPEDSELFKDKLLNVSGYLSYENDNYPTLVLQGGYFGTVGYSLDLNTGALSRVCVCGAKEASECACGAWD